MASARAVGFLVYIDAPLVERRLRPWLAGQDQRAVALRSVVAQWANLGAAATRVLRAELLQAAQECRVGGVHAQNVAAKIMTPALSQVLRPGGPDWGIAISDVHRALRTGPTALRLAAAQVLAVWQKAGLDLGPAEAWRRGLGPLFKQAWPQERRLKHPGISSHLAAFCAGADDAFPEAFAVVKPYLSVVEDGAADLFFLYNSPLPGRFPKETLDLLWALLRKRVAPYQSPELAKTLDAIKAAEPALEIDRRFQWLETKAMRLA